MVQFSSTAEVRLTDGLAGAEDFDEALGCMDLDAVSTAVQRRLGSDRCDGKCLREKRGKVGSGADSFQRKIGTDILSGAYATIHPGFHVGRQVIRDDKSDVAGVCIQRDMEVAVQ